MRQTSRKFIIFISFSFPFFHLQDTLVLNQTEKNKISQLQVISVCIILLAIDVGRLLAGFGILVLPRRIVNSKANFVPLKCYVFFFLIGTVKHILFLILSFRLTQSGWNGKNNVERFETSRFNSTGTCSKQAQQHFRVAHI